MSSAEHLDVSYCLVLPKIDNPVATYCKSLMFSSLLFSRKCNTVAWLTIRYARRSHNVHYVGMAGVK